MEKISQRAQRSIVLLKQNFILLKRTGKIPGDSYLEHTSREIHIYDRCEMKILHWVLPGSDRCILEGCTRCPEMTTEISVVSTWSTACLLPKFLLLTVHKLIYIKSLLHN